LAISRHASPHGGFLFEIRFPKRAHWQIYRGLRGYNGFAVEGQALDINKLLPLLLLKGNKGDCLESLLLLQALGLNLGNLGTALLGSSPNKPGLPPGTKTTYDAGKPGRTGSPDKA